MALSLFGSSSSTTGGSKTYDSEYGYLHTFVDLLERLIEIIFGLFSGLGSSDKSETPEDENVEQ